MAVREPSGRPRLRSPTLLLSSSVDTDIPIRRHVFSYIVFNHYIRSIALCFSLSLDSKVTENGWCPWCNGYRHREWTRRHEFKSWTRLIAFHIALIPLGKV